MAGAAGWQRVRSRVDSTRYSNGRADRPPRSDRHRHLPKDQPVVGPILRPSERPATGSNLHSGAGTIMRYRFEERFAGCSGGEVTSDSTCTSPSARPELFMEAGTFSVSECVYTPGCRFPEHAHECAGFCMVLEGGFSQRHGRRTISCDQASLLFCPADAPHADVISTSGSRCPRTGGRGEPRTIAPIIAALEHEENGN